MLKPIVYKGKVEVATLFSVQSLQVRCQFKSHFQVGRLHLTPPLPTHLSDPKFKRSAALVQNKTKRSEEAKAICEKADLLSFPCAAADFDDLVQQNLVGSNGKPLSAEEIEGRKIGEIGGLVSKGMYANQLRGWLALFPRENLHVALF